MLNKQVHSQKQAMVKILQTEEMFIHQLKQTNIPLEKGNRFKGLDEDDQKIAEAIFDRKDVKHIKGKEASKFFSQVKLLSEKVPSKAIEHLLSEYE